MTEMATLKTQHARSRFSQAASFCLMVLVVASTVQVAGAQEKRKFTIAYASEWSPYSYGLGTEVDGMLPRLMDRIFAGIDGFELVHDGLPWERAQQVFFGGRVDGMVATATQKRLMHARKSNEAALEIPFHPIVRRGSPLKDRLLKDQSLAELKDYRYCDVLGNGWAEEFYRKRHIEFSISPTIDNCLQQLKLNRVDIVIHAKPVLEIFSKQLGLEEELEIVDLKYDESPLFPLLVSNAYAAGEELIEQFDREVERLKEGDVYEEFMDELVDREKGKPAS
ncbi:substrate-binding periplasmic protein [Roseibium sp. M-1]